MAENIFQPDQRRQQIGRKISTSFISKFLLKVDMDMCMDNLKKFLSSSGIKIDNSKLLLNKKVSAAFYFILTATLVV